MFKIKQKIVFGLLLMSTAMIFMNYQVKADNGEAIFDQQTLEEVESKIEGKRIFQDLLSYCRMAAKLIRRISPRYSLFRHYIS